ncbi:MAG: ABC transporter ATP-binding protein/permease [Bacteroidales bacterium]|jgi:ATP-binding cassette subfamily B protein|nr:ABC transporter ATP-binding protein/permease [Bacteroidales bacterium]
MKLYWQILKRYKKFIILSPLLVLGFVFCETAQPTLMASIIDEGVMKKDMDTIIHIGIIMISLSVVAIGLSIANVYCASKTAIGFSTDLRKKMFSKIQTFSFADIDTFSTASLITRMTNDTTVLQQIVMRTMLILYRAPMMMVIALFYVISMNTKMAAFLGIALPVLGICIFLVVRKGYPVFTQVQQKLDKLNEIVRENLIGIRVVKSFVREDLEKKKFNKSNEEYRDSYIKALDILVLVFPAMQLIMNSTVVFILWSGGISGLQIGSLISLVNYSMQILMALMLVSMTFVMLARAAASSKRVLEVMKTEPSITNTPESLQDIHKILKGDITFKNVFFKYNPESENYVLKDINFHIDSGETIAVVGATGSAKSTLLQLIPRLYDVNNGEILIDDINIKSYSLNELRESIGVVLQNNTLFSGTILANIKWGNPGATIEEIEEAAKIAEAHDFITSFSKSYDTIVGQSGVNLSGGQKQRICIARALLKKPKILILDNSTSAVDTDTEKKIKENFAKLLGETTVILVTQRFSSMQNSDKVIVLEDGMIESMGTPSELLEKSKIYQEIANSQKLIL